MQKKRNPRGAKCDRELAPGNRRDTPRRVVCCKSVAEEIVSTLGIRSQAGSTQELEEIPVERNTKEDLHCTPAMHTRYTSSLGQINWFQRGTQFQFCYKFSSCASMAASPTFGDVKALKQLARQLKSQPVKLQFWPLTGQLRILRFLDASY